MPIKRLNTADAAQGGQFVLTEVYDEVNRMLRDGGCVEGFAKHFPMSALHMDVPKFLTGLDGYWVNAMEVKPKDKPTFEMKRITAELMAVIVLFENQLLADASEDLAGLVKDDAAKAFVEALDRTYLGYEVTSPFASSISGNVPVAATIAFGTDVDLAGDISQAVSAIEVAGFDGPTGMVANPAIKHLLRNLRDTNNQLIFTENLSACTPRERYCVWGIPICFTRQAPLTGSPEGYEILMMYGPYVFIGDRSGMDISISTEATISQAQMDNVNLFEQNMTALRFEIRRGFEIKQDDALAKVTGVTI